MGEKSAKKSERKEKKSEKKEKKSEKKEKKSEKKRAEPEDTDEQKKVDADAESPPAPASSDSSDVFARPDYGSTRKKIKFDKTLAAENQVGAVVANGNGHPQSKDDAESSGEGESEGEGEGDDNDEEEEEEDDSSDADLVDEDALGDQLGTVEFNDDLSSVLGVCKKLDGILKSGIYEETSSKKRKSLLDVEYPTAKSLKKLGSASKDSVFTHLAQHSLTAAQQLLSTLSCQTDLLFPSSDERRSVLSVSDTLLQDVELNQRLPTKQQYVEMGLWRKVSRNLHHATVRVDDLFRKLKASEETNDTQKNTNGEPKTSFRDYYVSQFTSALGNELDTLRKNEEPFDEKRVTLLVDAIESGVDVISAVEKELCEASFEMRRPKKQKQSSTLPVHSTAPKY